MRKRWIVVAAIVALALVALPVTGLAAWASVGAVRSLFGGTAEAQTLPVATPQAAPAAAQITQDDTLLAIENALGRIYDEVSPSVVSIQVVQSVTTAVPGFPFAVPDEDTEQYEQASGSGFVWDTQGHIVTNNHVVEGADRIQVRFYDGYTVDATVVGTDPDSDLAVVKVDVPADRLQPVTLADSTQVRVGQLSVAIGNPFNLESTMTVGFVSALGRSMPVDTETTESTYSIPDIIQTDAPINPGNSGGVLVDQQGRVIGVTTAIVSPVRASSGIGYAVPSVIVGKVVPAIIESGAYVDPWIGVVGTSLTPDLAEAMDLDREQQGGLIIEVVPDSPADDAGLRGSDRTVTIDGTEARVGGDVIIAVDGEAVTQFDDVIRYLSRHTVVGDELTLTVIRDGRQTTVELTLAARPEEESATRSPDEAAATERGAWLGVTSLGLSPALNRVLGLDLETTGVLVVGVASGSPADEAGLRGGFRPVTINGIRVLLGGDVITALGGEPVASPEDLQTLLAAASPGDEVTITILRDGAEQEVSVTLGER